MNVGMQTSEQGLRLLMEFEKGPTDGSVPLSENGAALSPYVCPGDELTIGYGNTHWFDGEEVAIHHRLKDDSEAIALLKYNLPTYEGAVIKGAKRPLTQYQFDAFVCRAFNIGIGAFSGSSALRSFNEGRFEDAASDFGMWTGSTTARPPKKYRDNPDYAPKLIQDHKGLWRWKGPDGQYCRYMLRLPGLLDRCYAEGLLFMGRDFMRTIRSPERLKLELTPEHPSKAKWNATKGRWQDEVEYRTPFKTVLTHAWDDALPEPTDALLFDPAPKEPAAKVAHQAPLPDSAIAKSAPPVATDGTGGTVPATPNPAGAVLAPQKPAAPVSGPAAGTAVASSVPSTPPPVVKPPVVAPPLPKDAAPAGLEPKDMLLSKRFYGLAITAVGTTHFIPRGASEWMNNEGNRELLSWLIVVIVGVILYQYGKYKAKKPLK